MTSFRTLANTLIAVPNARLATEAIDNISRRQKILYRSTVRIHHESTTAQIRKLMDEIIDVLDNNERALEGHRVRFVSIAETSLEIEVFTYFDTSVWTEYLELAGRDWPSRFGRCISIQAKRGARLFRQPRDD